MKKTVEYVDGGASTCGHCGEYFSDDREPVEAYSRVEEESGTYTYREVDPWHEDCIVAANAELEGGK